AALSLFAGHCLGLETTGRLLCSIGEEGFKCTYDFGLDLGMDWSGQLKKIGLSMWIGP
ncbi:hypothetical protein Droror1_Dr00027203, partial [Drosera rotundifolia]